MAPETPHGDGPPGGDNCRDETHRRHGASRGESPTRNNGPPGRDVPPGADGPVAHAVERAAIDRVERYLARATARGRVVFPLVDLAAETALDPATVAAAMARLGRDDRFEVSRRDAEYGERRWLVRV